MVAFHAIGKISARCSFQRASRMECIGYDNRMLGIQLPITVA